MEKTLGKKALDMLNYNGYSIRYGSNEVSFMHSSTDRIGLISMMVLCAFISFFLFTVQPFVGLGALLICGLIFAPLLKRSVGKLAMSINKQDQNISVHSDSNSSMIPFDQVSGIFTRSTFVDEYSSAFKSTSKEYQVTIGFEMDNQKLLPIFRLISDHEKPSKEMDEVVSFLQSEIKKS